MRHPVCSAVLQPESRRVPQRIREESTCSQTLMLSPLCSQQRSKLTSASPVDLLAEDGFSFIGFSILFKFFLLNFSLFFERMSPARWGPPAWGPPGMARQECHFKKNFKKRAAKVRMSRKDFPRSVSRQCCRSPRQKCTQLRQSCSKSRSRSVRPSRSKDIFSF